MLSPAAARWPAAGAGPACCSILPQLLVGGHGLLFSGLDWPWLTVPLVNGLFALYLLRESSRPLKLLEAIGQQSQHLHRRSSGSAADCRAGTGQPESAAGAVQQAGDALHALRESATRHPEELAPGSHAVQPTENDFSDRPATQRDPSPARQPAHGAGRPAVDQSEAATGGNSSPATTPSWRSTVRPASIRWARHCNASSPRSVRSRRWWPNSTMRARRC